MSTVEVRDAVHGLVPFDAQVWAVVNTRAFQRLRRVQQLAFTHLVYPGARHSRFEHCMGAAHVAGRLARQVQEDPLRVQLAALVHDIGHGPFSHVSEHVFESLAGGEDIHEKISAAIIRFDPAVSSALGDEMALWISNLLTHSDSARKRSFERDVVSGPSDIDKLDYLLRDSHYCGVNYGVYDLEKVIETAKKFDDSVAGESYLAFDVDGQYALEEMLVARYHMSRQVYSHKTRVGIDLMLVRAMLLGVREGVLPADIFTPPTDPTSDFVHEYLRYDDYKVIQSLCEAPEEKKSGHIMRALIDRRLCKRAKRADYEELTNRFSKISAGYALKPDKGALETIVPRTEEEIARVLGVDPIWVMLNWNELKSPLTNRYSLRVESSDILLVDRHGKEQQFHDVSEIFTRRESPPSASISLYVKPKDDEQLTGRRRDQIIEIMFSGLEEVSRSSAAL